VVTEDAKALVLNDPLQTRRLDDRRLGSVIDDQHANILIQCTKRRETVVDNRVNVLERDQNTGQQ
jgi:hypothetical protein